MATKTILILNNANSIFKANISITDEDYSKFAGIVGGASHATDNYIAQIKALDTYFEELTKNFAVSVTKNFWDKAKKLSGGNFVTEIEALNFHKMLLNGFCLKKADQIKGFCIVENYDTEKFFESIASMSESIDKYVIINNNNEAFHYNVGYVEDGASMVQHFDSVLLAYGREHVGFIDNFYVDEDLWKEITGGSFSNTQKINIFNALCKRKSHTIKHVLTNYEQVFPEVIEPSKYYTITFNPGDGVMPEGVALEYGIDYDENYKEATGIDYPIPTMYGWLFQCWRNSEDNQSLIKSNWDTDTYKYSKNIVLTAEWVRDHDICIHEWTDWKITDTINNIESRTCELCGEEQTRKAV